MQQVVQNVRHGQLRVVRGPPPIRWQETRAVSQASILAVRSLREGVPFEIASGALMAGVEGEP